MGNEQPCNELGVEKEYEVDISQNKSKKTMNAEHYDEKYDEKQCILENEKKDVDFKIFVGIDFGTDGCGLAYAVKKDIKEEYKNENALNLPDDTEDIEHVEIHTNFKDAHGPYDKSRTSVLLDANDNVQSVGGEAANMFVQMKDKKNWKLFERFKMDLSKAPDWKSKILPKNRNKNVPKVDLEDTIIPTNGGEPFPSKAIFVAELTRLKELALEYLELLHVHKKKILFTPNESDIQWILTVPAIWSDYAKNKMETWAKDAKLINANIRNHLKIVYEPDCASLAVRVQCNKWNTNNSKIPIDYIPKTHDFIQYDDIDTDDDEPDGYYGNLINDNHNDDEYKYLEELDEEMKYTAQSYTQHLEENVIKLSDKNDPGIRFNCGDIYILVDSGGGTCDIACHECINRINDKEILHPTGGQWGSMNIDKQFVALLILIFGAQTINEFKQRFAGMWIQLKDNFCNGSKASFYNNKQRKKEYHHVTLPSHFAKFITEKYGNDIGKVNELLRNKSTQLFNKDKYLKWELIGYTTTSLAVHNKIFIDFLFEQKSVTPIINHLTEILYNNVEMRQCKYMILVGGLANSRYYQQRIYNAFGRKNNNKIKIIIPEKAQLCVVEGAARMGLNPYYIQSRKLAKTYGIRIDYLKDSLANINEFDEEFLNDKNNHFICKHSKKEYIRNIFSVFASSQNSIRFDDEPIVQSYFRRHLEQKKIDIKIYSSTKAKPLHVLEEEMEFVGEIQLLFNTNRKNQTNELEILIEFCFNDTTLKVFAYPKNQKDMKQKYPVTYLL